MTPEMSRNYDQETDEQHSTAVDIWAVGVLTFVLLTGEYPHDADPDYDEEILKETYSPRFTKRVEKKLKQFKVPESARRFILACMSVDPSKRPTAQQLLQHEFVKNPDVDAWMARVKAIVERKAAMELRK